MFLAVGVGAFTAGVFHLMTHAFFKALLFLGAGSVIHALHAYHDEDKAQDLRNMGGLAKKMPITRWTFLIGTMAIAGVPLLSGFFSKDEILFYAFTNHHPALADGSIIPTLNLVFWAMGLVAALCTAFYMFRLYFLTFSGTSRTDPRVYETVHESPRTMTFVLVVLAVGAAVVGWLNVPFVPDAQILHHWLAPSLPGEAVFHAGHGGAAHDSLGTGLVLMAVAIAIAALGILLAWLFYGGQLRDIPSRIANGLGGLYRLALDKYRVDELYGRLVVRPLQASAGFLHRVVDVILIDTVGVRGAAFSVQIFGRVLRFAQSGAVQVYVAFFLMGVAALFLFAW